MKSNFFLVVALSLLLASCTKENQCSNSFRVKALLISCNKLVFQILDVEQFSLGENGWVKKTFDGATTYDHVFSVKNVCEVQKQISDKTDITSVIPIGTEFTVSIKDQYNDCGSCNLGYIYPLPTKEYAITVCK